MPIDPAILNTPSIILTEVEGSIIAAVEKSREKMAQCYNKKYAIETFVTDTLVTVLIPKEDHGTLDHLRLYARVVDQPHPGRYQLQTEHGILDQLYPIGVLNRVPNPELVGMLSLLFSCLYYSHILTTTTYI